MRITLVGSRHFGVTTFNTLRQHGVDIVRVVVHDGEDRLAATARAAKTEVVVQADPKFVTAAEIAPNTDLIVTAHSHARVTREALAVARLGGVGYHPSLLPRHRRPGMDIRQEGRDRARALGTRIGPAGSETARGRHPARQDPQQPSRDPA